MTPKPQNDPEMIGTEVPKEGLIMRFITDMDSISFLVKQGDFHLFCIILNQKDTVWAAEKGRYPKENFDEAYKKNARG